MKLTVNAATKAVKPISHFEDLNSSQTGRFSGSQKTVMLMSKH